MTCRARAVVLGVVIAGLGVGAGPKAQTSRDASPASSWTKKTPWGDPDLQAIWNNGTATPLQRDPKLGTKEFWTAEEFEAAKKAAASRQAGETEEQRKVGLGAGPTFWYEIGQPHLRTSLIIDPPNGRLPAYAPQAQKYVAERNKNLEEIPLGEFLWKHQGQWVRCITRGVPNGMIPTVYNNNYQFIQLPGYVVIHQEMIHNTRVIPLDGRPRLAPEIKEWDGDSRGRWEGQTLVVETTNFHPEAEFNSAAGGTAGAIPLGPGATVTERFTRQSATNMDYVFTVNAPATFVSPFTVSIPMNTTAASDRIMEYACIEGDRSVPLTVTALLALKAAGKKGELPGPPTPTPPPSQK
jgi:hypothetical protein